MINLKNVSQLVLNNKVIEKIEDSLGKTLYEAFKKLIASGVPPLTLTKCKGVDLVDYKIYGNSVQDGTPTPENPIEIQSVGDLVTDTSDSNYGKYKIPVKVTGKNLLNTRLWTSAITVSGLTIQYLEDEDCFLINGTSTDTRRFAQKYINLSIDKTKKYSLSTKYISGTVDRSASTTTTKYAVAYFGNGDEENVFSNWQDVKLDNNDSKKENLTNNKSYITSMWFYVNEGVTFNNYKVKIQLEESASATEYEPYKQAQTYNIYLDEPLRKVGDYADYIDFENKKVFRKIKKDILATTLPKFSFSRNWDNETHTTCYYFAEEKIYTEQPIVTHFKRVPSYGPTQTETGCTIHSGNGYIYFKIPKTLATNKTEMNTWLDSLEKPVEVHYPLATPTEETIELPNISTNKGTTIIEVYTSILPSNMEVKYYGKE